MKILTPILFLFLLSGCADDEFQFTPQHIALYANYKLQDTIYFESNKHDLDTMFICKIDSSQRNGTMMSIPSKVIHYRIQHLPRNNWTAGAEMHNDENGHAVAMVLYQQLITIEKDLSTKPEPTYYIGIHYRDFSGEIKDINSWYNDTLFQDLGVRKYWIANDSRSFGMKNIKSIDRIYWTEKYGLTAYYRRNGDFYKIKRR